MKKLVFATLAVVAVGCSSSNDESSPASAEKTEAQRTAFTALKVESKAQWKWIQHEGFATPMHISSDRKGAPILAPGADPVATTNAFFDKYKSLYKMVSPESELSVKKMEIDKLGMTHVRMKQQVHGIEVHGGDVLTHYDAKGVLTAVDAQYVSGISELDVNPAFDAHRAVEIAIKEAAGTADAGKLIVYARPDLPARLAYEVKVDALDAADGPAIWITRIDAKTGEILNRYNNVQTIEGSGKGTKGDIKKIQVTQSGTGFTMVDTSHGVTIQTASSNRQQVAAEEGAKVITSTNLNTWDATGAGAGSAVDAHFGAGIVFDYYKTVHGRNSIDGNGGSMMSAVHFGSAYDNAFWSGASMNYGDGGQLKPLAGGFDVIAHEFTHGVTQFTSNIEYQTESGALNESLSDIFAVFIEHSFMPDDTKNWLLGEEIMSPNFRDMKNPKAGGDVAQPDNMTKFVRTQQDDGGVHINSGIPNNAAYLMTMGGKNPTSGKGPAFGIGWEKSEKVWYRAQTTYLRTTANFAAAAQATMQAAKDLQLTDNESNIIDCAWKSTGVVTGDCATNIVDPKSVPAPSDDDSQTGDVPATGDDSADNADDSEDTTTTPKKKKKTTTQAATGGCDIGGSGSVDLWPLLGIMFAAARRRRK